MIERNEQGPILCPENHINYHFYEFFKNNKLIFDSNHILNRISVIAGLESRIVLSVFLIILFYNIGVYAYFDGDLSNLDGISESRVILSATFILLPVSWVIASLINKFISFVVTTYIKFRIDRFRTKIIMDDKECELVAVSLNKWNKEISEVFNKRMNDGKVGLLQRKILGCAEGILSESYAMRKAAIVSALSCHYEIQTLDRFLEDANESIVVSHSKASETNENLRVVNSGKHKFKKLMEVVDGDDA